MIELFGLLALPLGYVMEFLYNLVNNYGITIILFTILVRLLMFPLSLKQQQSTAKMSAYQPLIQEIQNKWAKDKNRQNQELQKFYEENNIKMTAGCLPMVVNMLVLFGIIAVIQAPLTYIIHMPTEQINSGLAIMEHYREGDSNTSAYTQQSILIGEIIQEPEVYINGFTGTDAEGNEVHYAVDAEWVDTVKNFNFNFLGLNLAAVPTIELNRYLIMPILSILTMLASQFIIMKTSGSTQGRSSMLIMTLVMGVMFGYFAFTVPVGFSLYYTTSNVVMTVQQLIVRKIYNPEKIRAEIEKEIEERKKNKKAKKHVKIQDDKGEVIEKELNESELVKLRLARAREMDAQKYADEEQTEKQTDDEKSGKVNKEKEK